MTEQADAACVRRRSLLAAAPLAAAIGVFGIVYGAASAVEFGAPLAIGMSLIVFSGAVQFAVLGLLAGGAGAAAVIVTVLALNARNLVLGAVLRSRLGGSRWQRAGLAWFLVDESFGLAVAARRHTAAVLLASGALFYAAWQVGTVLGVLGAQAVGLEGVASAVFPVLFIGLAAITANGRDGVARAIAAGLMVAGSAFLVPDLHAFAPIIAAVLVVLPPRREG